MSPLGTTHSTRRTKQSPHKRKTRRKRYQQTGTYCTFLLAHLLGKKIRLNRSSGWGLVVLKRNGVWNIPFLSNTARPQLLNPFALLICQNFTSDVTMWEHLQLWLWNLSLGRGYNPVFEKLSPNFREKERLLLLYLLYFYYRIIYEPDNTDFMQSWSKSVQ